MKIKGYIAKAELNYYLKTPIEKANGTPIVLEIWKDKEDFKDCCEKGTHIKEIEFNLN